MPRQAPNLLIVDDDRLVRITLSAVLAELGYEIRSAEDGFSALAALRDGIPDIVLSDLNMAGMSGFEFLSVVRRRFPAAQIIAMSGAFSSNRVPPGVVADAFYEKGTDLAALLRVIESMSRPERSQALHRHGPLAPIWIESNGHDHSGKPYVIVTCPECLRTFPQVLTEAVAPVHKTGCVHCQSLIHYAIVQPAAATTPRGSQPQPSLESSAPPGLTDFA